MIWIILCIISYIGIFVVFKLIDTKDAPLLNCIVINYFTAALLGFSIFGNFPIRQIISANWFPVSLILGFLFIATFILIGISSRKTGIVITTVASKMSLVIPMLFSILMYGEAVSSTKIAAIILAIASIFLCTYKPSNNNNKGDIWKLILPSVIFVGMGANDSLVIYSRNSFGISDDAALFTATLFAISFLCGLIHITVKKGAFKDFLKGKTWWMGILLGTFNFGSIYFVIKSMEANLISTSSLYGICNTSTILLSIVIGIVFFGERLSRLNIIGGILAIAAIILMAI